MAKLRTMDNNKPQTPSENSTPKPTYSYTESKSKSTNTIALIVMLILLLVAVGVIGYLYYQRSQDLALQQENNQVLEEQKNELQVQLQSMIVQYDSLRTDNDSVNLLLEAEQAKIKKLLSINANNAYKIKLYKKEMQTLRDIMKSYIVQIDSLNQMNEALTQENIEVRTQLRAEKTVTEKLRTEKEELSTTVAKASVLSAKNILAEPLNERSKPKYKVDKVAKIRTCFTVRENSIVEAGPIDIYMRITRPDGVVLASEAAYFDYQGQQMVYTAVRTLEYENVDIEMCIFWDNNESLVAGDYQVELYANANMIGETTFSLK
jgi:hypothetical protein